RGRSPTRPAGVGPLWRSVSDWLRSRSAHDHRAARAAGGHHYGNHRRSGLFMALASKILKRVALVVALIAATAELSVRATTDTAVVQAGPSAGQIPQRIISLVPATTEMLFAMGAGQRIAGVSDYDRFPPEVSKLPKVGGLIDPNVERVISLKPD